MNTPNKARRQQAGTSMVEILVTLIILMVGLLGLAGLMVQSQRSEMESYQRVQALVLLQDMAGRINANRGAATCYAYTSTAIGTPYLGTSGTGIATIPVPATACTAAAITAIYPSMPAATATLQATRAVADMNAWHSALLGAAETDVNNANVGAMVNARGCVSYGGTATELTNPANGAAITGTGVYTIAVAWQGLGDTFAPPAPVNNAAAMSCGKGLYVAETRRRVVSLTLRTASLTTQ